LLRYVLTTALLAGLFASPAAAKPVELMPGVTYDRRVEFTAHGPKVIHVLIAPKPAGLYALKPVLSNGTLLGRERVTAMQRRVSAAATVAGVNGDLFAWQQGFPSGMLMQDGVIHASPNSGRSSIGIGADGSLLVDRVSFFGTWQGSGQRRAVNGVNKATGAVVLYTPAWGPTTPAGTGTVEATLSAFPSATPATDLAGLVAQVKPNGGTPIPPNGAVLVARGAQGPRLAAEAPVGQTVTVRLTLKPDWTGVVDALGGGPLIVREGRPVFRAMEEFSTYQLSIRHPRSAVGQTADGRIVMLAVDGRQAGYSVGMTNFELALALMRFGVVTGTALDGGGSTTMAFDGTVLNRPSDGGERAVAEALLVHYYGVHAPPLIGQVLSPNGDGVDETVEFRYKVVRPSQVVVTLVGPDRVPRLTETFTRAPGTYRYSWVGRRPDGSLEQLGRWRWVVNALDDQGQGSEIERAFSLNDTIGYLRVRPSLFRPANRGARLVATVRLARPAKLVLLIETRSGTVLRRIVRNSAAGGSASLAWDGRTTRGGLVYSGTYVARMRAQNAAGVVELERNFRLQRSFRVPKRKPARPRPRR
jgi:phosphodiester glycosidase/flagellar hook capping protein FlgD